MKNIVLIGMPGCGKTTLGKLLAAKLKMEFYDADDVLEQREPYSIKEFLPRAKKFSAKLSSGLLNFWRVKKTALLRQAAGL